MTASVRLAGALAALSLSAAFAAGGGAVPFVWRARALDPRHVVMQCDPYDAEQAAFSLSKKECKLGGWKLDKAVEAAAAAAISGRLGFESLMETEPVFVGGDIVSRHALWKMPAGQMRFTLPDGRRRGVRQARVLYHDFVVLPRPLEPGSPTEFTMPDGSEVTFAYDPGEPSPLFKVNQAGYFAGAPRRYAYLGGWLGPLGPWPAPEDATFELVDAATGEVAMTGPVARRRDDPKRDGTPFCGEETCEMDISKAPAGRWFLRVPGVGRSMDFTICTDGVADAFALHMKGLFQQRCGCAKPESLTRWPDAACHLEVVRGTNPPGEGEYATRFTDGAGAPFKTKHFAVISAMIDSYSERLSLPGGWHDAADYDRRPMHMRIVGDLAVVYMLRPENFTDSQLAVPERGNGIPDILDEATWGLRHLLAGQQADGGVGTWIEGTRHPTPGDGAMPSADPVRYCLSRATRSSSVEYAGYAALLARALRKAGGDEAERLAGEFAQSAARAWDYAATAEPARNVPLLARDGRKTVQLFYSESEDDPNPEIVAKAAVNLYALTGDGRYAEALERVAEAVPARLAKDGWSMSPLILAETAFTEIPGEAFSRLRGRLRSFAVKEADAALKRLEESYPYRLPWFGAAEGWVHTMGWGNFLPLRQAMKFIAAHAVTGDAKYLDAAYLANDYHCGCNPNGTTLTSGLGRVYPVSYLSLASLADGIAEYVPGITPYRNSFGLPLDVKEFVWNGDVGKMRRYPYLRRWADIESRTVAVSEFTVWETIGPAAAVTGYLMAPGSAPEIDLREPASDVRDLPGFWALP